jgi:hypothetical protein
MVVNGQNGPRQVQAKVVEIGKKDITLDFNHPLAGKTLNFDVKILGVEKAPETPAAPMAPAKIESACDSALTCTFSLTISSWIAASSPLSSASPPVSSAMSAASFWRAWRMAL